MTSQISTSESVNPPQQLTTWRDVHDDVVVWSVLDDNRKCRTFVVVWSVLVDDVVVWSGLAD